MEQTVRLLGELGERYGAEHTYYNLRTPAEAIKLLCINYPKFQEELAYAHERGVGYQLVQADIELDYPDLHLPMGSKDLVLTPVITGSGDNPVARVFAGIGLVAAAIFLGPAAGGAAGFLGLKAGIAVGTGAVGLIGAQAAIALGAIGTSLILGGVAELISPQPQVPTFEGFDSFGSSARFTQTGGPVATSRATGGTQSYAYSGPANTVGVGATIPVAYGKVLIGSHLLSADIAVADDSDPVSQSIKAPGADTVLVGGEKVTSTFESASGVFTRRTDFVLKSDTILYPAGYTYRKLIDEDYALERGAEYVIFPAQGITREWGYNPNGTVRSSADNQQIIFELRNGLFDYVGAPGTTKVDGYISYKITLEAPVEGQQRPVGGFQSTIQGLLNPGQIYRWVQRFEFSDTTEGFNKWTLQILDFDADPAVNLRVHAAGYGFVD